MYYIRKSKIAFKGKVSHTTQKKSKVNEKGWHRGAKKLFFKQQKKGTKMKVNIFYSKYNYEQQ